MKEMNYIQTKENEEINYMQMKQSELYISLHFHLVLKLYWEKEMGEAITKTTNH